MNDIDKDLISAYLDGETNPDESVQVEALLDSNPEAFEYSNQLKRSNIEINDFFNGESMDLLEKSVDDFITEQSNSGLSPSSAAPRFNFGSLVEGTLAMLNPSRAMGAMAAFAIVGVLVLPMIFQNEFDDPDIYTIEISSLRSDGSKMSFEDILRRSLFTMTGSTTRWISKIVITQETDDIEVFLKLTEAISEDCWNGFALNNNIKRTFKFCRKDDNPLTLE
jgi:hypothetical protein